MNQVEGQRKEGREEQPEHMTDPGAQTGEERRNGLLNLLVYFLSERFHRNRNHDEHMAEHVLRQDGCASRLVL